jgi:beta-glucosidase
MSQPGCAAGHALADVLTGKAAPGGRLTATWAEKYSDYPCADSFSYLSGDLDDSSYGEGIYVGYRWFDSFNIRPAYPFGFGRSYTDFELNVIRTEICGESVRVTTSVKNIGSKYAGRETVQVYVSQPQGKLDKPYQVLAGFAKTKELAPWQEEVLEVRFPIRALASYDEESAAYVLEAGTYYVRVGNHSRNTHIAAALELDETIVTEQLQNKVRPDAELSVVHAEPDKFYTYLSEAAEKADAVRLEIIPASIPTRTADYAADPAELRTDKTETVTLEDVVQGRASLDDLTDREMWCRVSARAPSAISLRCSVCRPHSAPKARWTITSTAPPSPSPRCWPRHGIRLPSRKPAIWWVRRWKSWASICGSPPA